MSTQIWQTPPTSARGGRAGRASVRGGASGGSRVKLLALVLVLAIAVLALLAWRGEQAASHTEPTAGPAVSVGQVDPEKGPDGVAVDLVLLDAQGLDAGVTGHVHLTARVPGILNYDVDKPVAAAQAAPLPQGSLDAGRRGYRISIPNGQWAQPPASGTQMTLSVVVTPATGAAFRTETVATVP